jgi:4-hydroxybenzoate polyprenyltransferase
MRTLANTPNEYKKNRGLSVQKWKLPFWFTFKPYVNRVKLGEGGLVVFNLFYSVFAHRNFKIIVIEFFLSLMVLSALYAFNDYNDREEDVHNPKKDQQFIASIIQYSHFFLALNIFWTLLTAILASFLLEQYKSGVIVGLYIINVMYSRKLKAIPFADIIAVSLWGGIFIMLAGRLNLLLATIAGVMTGIAHIFQIITDKTADSKNQIKTSVVALPGSELIFLATVCFLLGGLLFVAGGIWWALSCFLPLAVYCISKKNVTLSWHISRIYFFCCWLALLNFYYGGV